ncbi:hypothetical protein [Microbulbifer zhoushanensis]|uniref:hypothetical protein n=1 Tax=Microbulbifer zhoushanensis TaxID=2904254 RepID=UPI001F2363DF|nr:hypothetical protein [Microbulbifer zhoushanensis]
MDAEAKERARAEEAAERARAEEAAERARAEETADRARAEAAGARDRNTLLNAIRSRLKDNSKTKVTDPLTGQKVEDLKTDRALRKGYAQGLLVILALQLGIMNLVFFLVGLGQLDYEQWSLNLYMAGTLAEIFGLVLVITKYLFAPKGK